jgi:hypothetical protein
MWWHTPVLPALKRLRWDDGEFPVSQGYIMRPCLKKAKKEKKNKNRKALMPSSTFMCFTYLFNAHVSNEIYSREKETSLT